MIKEHKQFNLPPQASVQAQESTQVPQNKDFNSSPNILYTAKDHSIKDKHFVTDTETKMLHGQKVKAKVISQTTSATYQVLLDDYVVGPTEVGVSRTFQLPKPSLAGFGKVFIIKDFSGSAASTTIAITPFSADTIDGDSSSGITANFGSKRLITDGANWFTL